MALKASPRRWHWSAGKWSRPNIPGLKGIRAKLETTPEPERYGPFVPVLERASYLAKSHGIPLRDAMRIINPKR